MSLLWSADPERLILKVLKEIKSYNKAELHILSIVFVKYTAKMTLSDTKKSMINRLERILYDLRHPENNTSGMSRDELFDDLGQLLRDDFDTNTNMLLPVFKDLYKKLSI